MPNDEPVSETQRRNLAEYAGTHAPRNHDEAYRLICSLEMRILNAINELLISDHMSTTRSIEF